MSEAEFKKIDELYAKKINLRLKEIAERFIWTDSVVVEVSAAETLRHLDISEAEKLKYHPVKDGYVWGQPWGTAWFKLRCNVPLSFRGEIVYLIFQTEGEAILYRNGLPVQALDHGRSEYRLLDRAKGGERIELYVEAGANSAFGKFNRRRMHEPRISVFNQEVWECFWDMRTLADLLDAIEVDTPRRAQILYVLNKAVDQFNYCGEPSRQELRAQAKIARRILKENLNHKAEPSTTTMACMGHAHIDVAWLWPLSETIRKCGRTFSNALELMRYYTEYKFVQSQPQLYEFTRQRFPSLYQRIKDMVRKKQWFPEGCMWVEADCNLSGGESLIRQLIWGMRFMKKEFDYTPECLWLPDVFGYPASLPQILKRSGITKFLTIKLSWNQITTFPFHSFWWEGIDGSCVLAHFPPMNNYGTDLVAKHLVAAARRYREKDRSTIQAVLYGYGDGGGGPNAGMLERMRRYRNLEEVPRLIPMSPHDFFRRLEQEAHSFPKWVGELYLEFHRGTYTTQSLNKRFNRKAEIALHNLEFLSSVAKALGENINIISELNSVWKLVLLNQFHDILPGSSIDEVYKDSHAQYQQVFKTTERLLNITIARLCSKIDTTGDGIPVVVFNTLSWDRNTCVAIKFPQNIQNKKLVAVAPDKTETPLQRGHDGLCRFIANVPASGYALFHIINSRKVFPPQITVNSRKIENEYLIVKFNLAGHIIRIYDKTARREILPKNTVANQFLLFEDKTATDYEAWDIDLFYSDKLLERDGKLLSFRVAESGPIRGVVQIKRRISKSIITQNIILYKNIKRIDFETEIYWGPEKHVLLKVAFPVNIRSVTAHYDIQFGNVERPTHQNTPRDLAMFEVPAHKWADLSEPNYGVALLNDCKYGYDIRGNVIRLTLLRAPKHPAKTSDVNRTHHITYSIFPHTGNFTNGVVQMAYDLNIPLIAHVPAKKKKGKLPASSSWFSVSPEHIVLETVKKAEEDDSIILRLYESHGCHTTCTLKTILPVKRSIETNLLEQEEQEIPVGDRKITLEFTPFQIRTIKLIL